MQLRLQCCQSSVKWQFATNSIGAELIPQVAAPTSSGTFLSEATSLSSFHDGGVHCSLFSRHIRTLSYLLPAFIITLLHCSYLTSNHLPKRPASPPPMAWMSTGSSNAALIKNLASNGLITSERVKTAMLAVRPAPLPIPALATANFSPPSHPSFPHKTHSLINDPTYFPPNRSTARTTPP